jgi:hypothetical protein
MTTRVTIDRRNTLAIVTVSGCATCDADEAGAHAPAFTIELPDGAIHFELCAACILAYGSPKRRAREQFRAALFARLAAITADIHTTEQRAALHPEGGHA